MRPQTKNNYIRGLCGGTLLPEESGTIVFVCLFVWFFFVFVGISVIVSCFLEVFMFLYVSLVFLCCFFVSGL